MFILFIIDYKTNGLLVRVLCEIYGAQYVSLHVRQSNKAAIHLYRDTLEFDVKEIVKKYYGNGEDANYMKYDYFFFFFF